MGLRNLPGVKLDAPPRMADSARFAVAASRPIVMTWASWTHTPTNCEEAHATVIESSTLGVHLRALVLVSGSWEGTASLLAELNARAAIPNACAPWPQTSQTECRRRCNGWRQACGISA